MLKKRVLIGILVLLITGSMPAYTWGDTIPPTVTPSAAAGSIETQTYVIAGGEVLAWGDNQYGQLGDGTFIDSSIPIRASVFVDVVEVSGGDFHTIILRKDGTVWAWGLNNFGQLGDGTQSGRTVPVQVSGLTGIVGIAGGRHHSIALKNNGTGM